MENNIKSKVVIITGASSGMGEAAAKHLSALGATVVLAIRYCLELSLLPLPKTANPQHSKPMQKLIFVISEYNINIAKQCAAN